MNLAKKSKVNLPQDWIVVNSTSFPDRVYYFNVRTGQSSWQEPCEAINKETSGKLLQKRQLSDTEREEIPTEILPGPSSTIVANECDRPVLRAKRCLKSPKAKETPQMKQIRLKILKQKQSKLSQNDNSKAHGSVPDNCEDNTEKATKRGKSECRRRFRRSQSSDGAAKPVDRIFDTSSTWNAKESGETGSIISSCASSSKKPTATMVSNATVTVRPLRAGSRRKPNSSKSSPGGQNETSKRNLANERLENLKKHLNEQSGGTGTTASSLSTSSKKPTATIVLNAPRTVKTPRAESERKSISSNSSPGSQNEISKKNLAYKRLENLKKHLNEESKKIEPAITAKIMRRLLSLYTELEIHRTAADSNSKDISELLENPTGIPPNISQNVDSRFGMLRDRLMTNSTFSNVDITEIPEKSNNVPVVPSTIAKTNKRACKKRRKVAAAGAVEVATGCDEPCASVDCPVDKNLSRDSFCEEMEWEPIEEEKVIFEVQEVRMQLLTDQNIQQKLPECTVNGLEFSQVSQNTDKRTLYIVVDTNVYLSNLKTVSEILDDSRKRNGHYKPVVVVPWTVLQELDYIKDNKSKTKSSHLQRCAKIAVDMLFKYFSSKHPRLKGQTAEDAALNRTKFQVESPDDEILQSCLQIRELGYTVVLLSNDKNLCNKAMVHNVATYGRHESIQEVLSPNKNKLQSKLVEESPETIENHGRLVDSIEADISDDIFCESKAIIKQFLSTIVSKEMENLYGNNWKKYTIVQPPWSVADVLKCTSKHWIAAISDVFKKQAESLVAQLSKMFLNAPKYGQSLKYVNEVLDVCNDLVQMVKSKQYIELAENTCRAIQALIDTCKMKLKELQENRSHAPIEVENNNLSAEQRADNAFKYFEQIWTFTNNFCGLAADLSGIPHAITYKSVEEPLPAETMQQLQPELVLSLNQLIHVLRTALNEDGYLTADNPTLIALHQILINYLPNSEEGNDPMHLDIIDLLCCINVKKEFLKTGLAQLQELCYQFCRIADYRSTTSIVNN